MAEMTRRTRNAKLKKELVEYFKSKGFIDWRVYANNTATCYNDGELSNIKPSTYFEYANDKTVCVSFEGTLYRIMNYPETVAELAIYRHIEKLFDKYGYYFEFGHAWNIRACDK